MNTTHILENIPPDIQERYNIGESVEVEADSSVGGGHFTLCNKQGRHVGIDAVELCGTDITIRRKPHAKPA